MNKYFASRFSIFSGTSYLEYIKEFYFFNLLFSKNAPITSPRIPAISGWLYHNNSYADWLGAKYFGKILREPINIIIIDDHSSSEEAAVQKLLEECKRNGYADEYGHSSNYSGIIEKVVYSQIPNNKHMAFANKDFFKTNNHGRILGPAKYKESFIFISGFSTERPEIKNGFRHSFVSFNKARNDYAYKMNKGSVFKVSGFVNLNNIINTNTMTTADHDGNAIVLEATK